MNSLSSLKPTIFINQKALTSEILFFAVQKDELNVFALGLCSLVLQRTKQLVYNKYTVLTQLQNVIFLSA